MSGISSSRNTDAAVLMAQQIANTRSRLCQQIHAFFAARQITQLQITQVEMTPGDVMIPLNDDAALTSAYQLITVQQDIEPDRKHARQFSLLQWYLADASLQQRLEGLNDLLEYITDQPIDVEIVSYKQAFLRRLEINPLTADIQLLKNSARRLGLNYQFGENKADWLQLLFKQFIEPTLGINQPVYLSGFSPDLLKAKQLEMDEEGFEVSASADLYIDGVKVATVNDHIKLGLERLLMVLLDIRRIDRVM